VAVVSIFQLPDEDANPIFPAPHLANLDGLLAVGGGLTPEWLIMAYANGIFPWYDEGPILWWSPDPRMVLFPADLHVPRSTLRHLKKKTYRVTLDTAFEAVLRGCSEMARPDQHGTWINDAMIAAYVALHRQGYAHSVEVWRDGALVGGLYGVAIGAVFCGESMFAKADDASKVAFSALVPALASWGYKMVDCQMHTDHLARFGATEIPRAEFLSKLSVLTSVEVSKKSWLDL
jgi:leucyl/phenylalanyl-tRNA--protein transferase